ncbi:ABC-F type ribosomal protection protein [Paenibacillus sp. VCA1]|uniref:ribosomal protection-like ABC-F family protein n=1 Tax=Paenibacillus sp. VCA1 TaxID=3039148 RepID=UPI00287279F7|nr:ABC-F type ribosomal protection protein [Paenibacillus sp. VCA1]MDR9856840.1 ABC-F type ribosomal protection protein [Paenibacillus sp. VCA1]
MMNIMKAKQLTKEFKGKTIFENVDFEIFEGERVALFGANGAGKTTLLNILTGRLSPDRGSVERGLPLEQWGMMEQGSESLMSLKTLDAAGCDSGEVWRAKQNLKQLEQRLADPSASEDGTVLDAYGQTLERYEQLGGFQWEIELERVLTMLNIGPELWELPFADLSGGQKTRVRLAALLAKRPAFLLLDEPTNHLDGESMAWLETWLNQYDGTVLIVSHDRTFLDRVATGIWELTPTGAKKYKGGYSDYKREKERELREQEALYKKQKQAKEALEESIRRYQEWFHHAEKSADKNTETKAATPYYKAKAKKNISRYHAKQKELERLEKDSVQKPRDTPKVHMQLGDGGFAARYLLRLEDVTFGYDDVPLFRDLDFDLSRGDRMAVRGPNGSGKSTLLKLVLGELEPDQGNVWMHPAVRIGYFSQELEGLNLDETLLDSLLRLPDMTETHARTILGCFLFSREDVFKKIGNLSMGEKCRAAFVQLYFSGANLLVLDEPTNYLDIQTREVVEEALASYPGALLVVSHDRMLVRKLANRLLTLSPDHEAALFEGTVEEEEERMARHGGVLNEDPERENRRLALEWEIARLLEIDEAEGAEERIRQIRSLRKELESL